MRFSWKVFLCTLLVVAVGLSVSGYVLVSAMFDASLRRETRQALEENGILRFAFEMSALNATAKYQPLSDRTVARIGASLGQPDRMIRISDESRAPLYAGADFAADAGLLLYVEDDAYVYRVTRMDGRYYMQTAAVLTVLDRTLSMETLKDVSVLFSDRDAWLWAYRRVSLVTLAFVALVTYAVSLWLTRPVRHLSAVARSMAQGNVRQRARQMSRDEMGQLTQDFNHMANTLEEQINRLKAEAKAREDFVAAFAHELKTPLTAMIGFADTLRSRILSEEKRFAAAQYIYREGKRLESLSLRLLDLIALRRREPQPAPAPVAELFACVAETFSNSPDLSIAYDDGKVLAEAALIETVLINLVDNARKASAPGQTVSVEGRCGADGYRFTVRDQGSGIPPNELKRITEPFYMIDKSRSGSHGGAGLGLSLCAEILELHGSSLEIKSDPGQGAEVNFVLPLVSLSREASS